MSGTLTLRPDAVLKTVGGLWAIGGGAASLNAAVSDNSDVTYITDTAATVGEVHFKFGTAALPALAVIKSITPRIRASQAAGSAWVYVSGYATGVEGVVGKGWYNIPSSTWSPTPTITTKAYAAGGYWTGSGPYGAKTPQSVVDEIVLMVSNSSAPQDHRIYEVYLDVVYDEAPVTSGLVLSPSNAATRTLTPTLTWAYADPEGSPQVAWDLAIWTNADTLDANFPASNPFVGSFTKSAGGTATQAYGYGGAPGTWSVGSRTSHAVLLPLTSGTAYKAYVRSADAPNGVTRYGPVSIALSFTPSVVAPPTPVAPVVTAEMASYRYKLDLAVQANLLTENAADPETGVSEFWASTNVTISNDLVNPAASGVGSLRMTSVAAGDFTSRTNISTPVVAGKVYTAVASYRSAVTSRSAQVNIDWRSAAGASISVTSGTASATAVGSYTQFTVSATAPAGAVVAWLQFKVFAAAAAAEVLNVDKIGIWPGTSTAWTPGGQTVGRKVEVEHSLDGGTYWSPIPASVPTRALGSENNQELTVYDTLIMGTRTPRYRMRTRWIEAATNLETISAWSTVTIAASAAVVSKFVLRDPDDPALFVVMPLSMGDLEDSSDEQVGVFDPVGGSYPVVVSSGFNSRRWSMQATFRDAFVAVTFKQLRATRKTLLLLDDMGGFTWVRFGSQVSHSTIRNAGRVSPFTRTEQFDFELIESIAPTDLPQLIY